MLQLGALDAYDADKVVDKSRIVEEGNYHKFTKGKESPEMLKRLMATGDRELVEVLV